MAVSPMRLSAATELLIFQVGWVAVMPGTLQFIQQPTMLDENGDEIPLPEPFIQFMDTGDPGAVPPVAPQAQAYPWRSVNGARLTALVAATADT